MRLVKAAAETSYTLIMRGASATPRPLTARVTLDQPMGERTPHIKPSLPADAGLLAGKRLTKSLQVAARSI
jgi:hypothetical protein